MSRLELCQRLIEETRRCLENNDRDCVMRKIEELVKADCHNGNAVGKEVADRVRNVVHELWLISDSGEVCRLLMLLRGLGTSRNWVREALGMSTKSLSRWLTRCNIDWEARVARNDVVKEIEDLLRRLGWSEAWMCEELFRFIGVDVNAFRRLGIEPCVWLNDLEKLGDLKKPYWFGLRASDLTVREFDDGISLEIDTTGSVDAVFFPTLLNTVKTPSLIVKRERGAPAAKYVHGSIKLEYYISLGVNEWPWPIELSADELERILDGFSDEELAMFVAGLIDGDGAIQYVKQNNKEKVFVLITACKNCPKRFILDALKDVIARRFGITGNIKSYETDDALVFSCRKAIRLLRRIVKYIHHPLRRLRAELILAYYDGKISKDEFTKLYEQTKYKLGAPDIKRNHGLEALARAAPQTHTHGE